MSIFCAWMAALIFLSAIGWCIYKENVDQLIQFLLGVAFSIFIWIATTM